jgi:acetoin utilization protein AcuB
MFVSKSMTRKVQTIGPEASVMEAQQIMSREKIRHLPVVDEKNRLLGIVTDRDIRSALPSTFLGDSDVRNDRETIARLTAQDLMTKNPITVSPMDTLQDALLLIQKARVGAFPVVDEQGLLVGIISVRDLIRAFINVLGIGDPGTLIGILVEEKVGQMKKIVDAITEEKVSFGSILVARYWEPDKRAVFPYLLTLNVAPIKRKLKSLGYTLIDPMEWYMDQIPKK